MFILCLSKLLTQTLTVCFSQFGEIQLAVFSKMGDERVDSWNEAVIHGAYPFGSWRGCWQEGLLHQKDFSKLLNG